jgi:maltose O-acetyltransferase
MKDHVFSGEEAELPALVMEAMALLARSARNPRFGAEKARRAVAMARARLVFRGCTLGARVSADGKVLVRNQGSLSIGSRVHFMGGMLPTRLTTGPAGTLIIGERCVFNYGAVLDAQERIEIGSGCLFGSMVQIIDTSAGASGPIVFGDEVWVAHGVVVQPGVKIGSGAVLSAGAVITADVPAGHMAIGNPARAMKVSTARGAR